MFKIKNLYKYFFLLLITIFTIFILKNNENYRNKFCNSIYNNNISFATINNWYKLKFGSPIPFANFFSDVTPVFNEEIEYKDKVKYKDGVSLTVDYEYLVPSMNSGIIIFIGEKKDYGNTIIVQQENGIDVWYSNINEINVSLYDYIKKGTLLGNVNNKLYLLFMKNGDVVDYNNYI